MSNSTLLILFMLSILSLGLVMYLSSLPESNKLFKFESKLFEWLRTKKVFIDKVEQATISHSNAHEIVVSLGERLEKEDVESYQKIKSELHPQAIEYFHRTKGMNVEPAVVKKPKLKLVK